VLSGRFGNYVTDGETNATMPKDQSPEELTFEQALRLLADRAAKGPSKKRAFRKKAVVKSSTKPSAAKKTAKKAVKKTARKTTAKATKKSAKTSVKKTVVKKKVKKSRE